MVVKHQRFNTMENFPYTVELSGTHIRAEHVKWLEEMFPNGYKSLWTFIGPYKMGFKDERSQILFVLRWS